MSRATRILKEYQSAVAKVLERDFQRLKAERGQNHKSSHFIEELGRYSLRGGKRLRASLIYFTYLIFSDENLEEIIDFSSFIELIQTFLLTHDDIMDQDDLRRGGPTYHKVYEDYAEEHDYVSPILFGESLGILAGDCASMMAFDKIASAEFISDKNKVRIIKVVTDLLTKTIFGQLEDIHAAHEEGLIIDDVIRVYHLKTAKYTYETPVVIGGILGGASDEVLHILKRFSIAAGIAFQIRDDILGIFGDTSKTGKSDIGDLREGKKTILVNHMVEHASRDQLRIFKKYFGKENMTQTQAEKIRNIILDCGSLEYANYECVRYVNTALFELSFLPEWVRNTEGYQFLVDITNYVSLRNK